MGDALKLSFRVTMQALLQVLLGTVKDLYDNSFPYSTAVLPVLYLLRLARPKVQLNLSYSVCNVIFF